MILITEDIQRGISIGPHWTCCGPGAGQARTGPEPSADRFWTSPSHVGCHHSAFIFIKGSRRALLIKGDHGALLMRGGNVLLHDQGARGSLQGVGGTVASIDAGGSAQ